jgi:hypothetical protein
MQHPFLTAAFDLILIGTAASVIAALVAEHFASRQPAVGACRWRERESVRVSPASRWGSREAIQARPSRRAA